MSASRLASACALALISLAAFGAGPASAQSAAARSASTDFDHRAGNAHATVTPAVRAARKTLGAQLGARGILKVEPATGRLRVVGRLDRRLTGPSRASAAEVARRYLRDNASAFGLARAQIEGLHVGSTYRGGGLVRVQLTQSYGGVMSIDSGIRAVLDSKGRLVELIGAPDPNLRVAGTDPAVSRSRAAVIAATSAGVPTRASNAKVSQVIFHIGQTARLGWRSLVAASPRERYDVIVDGTSGAVVSRVNMVVSANAATVFPAWPDAPVGGSQVGVDLAPYLDTPAAPTRLNGPYAHAFTDATDVVPGFGGTLNTTPAPGSEVGPSAGTDFTYPFNGLTLGVGHCPTSGASCAWNPATAFSWLPNRMHDATQLFWQVNTFHDHLSAPPIGFTAADGAFEGDDPIIAQSHDGADTNGGLPDFEHLDNANFMTPPDGTPGFMQMYLFGGTEGDPFFWVSGTDDTEIVYHEYTHGLSNRLITYPDGYGALWSLQSGAMGEAWSDWYAFDALDKQGNLQDTPGVADLREGAYVEGTQNLIRTEPIDCPVGTTDPGCPGTPTAGRGGYTFGDLGQVIGGPEVHADGEIWSQMLWQLREGLIADHGRAAGIDRVEELVTNAMRLSPPQPTFLDERDAIVQADAASSSPGQDFDRIWQVFASRGMGWYAYEETSDNPFSFDVNVHEDFSLPPAPGAGSATVQGIVQGDSVPLAGVRVEFSRTGLGRDLSAITGADGRYSIPDVPAGTYPRFRALVPHGYAGSTSASFTVPGSGTATRDFVVHRNWASGPAGAYVRSATGNGGFCGPSQLIDDDQSTSWSTLSPLDPYGGGPKSIVVGLPADITVTGIAIDPTPGCFSFFGPGDVAAALADYRVKVARDDDDDPGPFQTVARGKFGPSDLGGARDVTLSSVVPGVRFVELQALTNSGDDFSMDVAELQVFGHETTAAEGGGGTATPEVTTLAADDGATTSSSVTFRASVVPHGAPTTVRIEFGVASGQVSYQTADVAVPGNESRTLSLAAGGLLPNTTYYYRAVATNSRGAVRGGELTVTTSRGPVQPPTPPTPPKPAGSQQQRYAKTSCTVSGRNVTCTLASRLPRTDGARARLSRNHRTYAVGKVTGHVLRMRAARTVKPGKYVLKITKGHGKAALVRRIGVKI